jgi:hypothetical protein
MDRRDVSRRPDIIPICLFGGVVLVFIVVALFIAGRNPPGPPAKEETGKPELTPRAPVKVKVIEPSTPRAFLDRSSESTGGAAHSKAVEEPLFHVVSRAKKPAGPVNVREAFDKTDRGLPQGWSSWTNQSNNVFGVSDQKALSAPHSLAISGSSALSARAWYDEAVATDVLAGAAVYLNSLILAQVFVRGERLKSAQPTYYAAAVSRGLEVQLVRMVRGSAAVLGTVKSSGYLSEKWVRVTIQAKGKQLRVQVLRPDSSQYLDEGGQWVTEPTWAITRADTAITASGFVGLARPARYNGTLFFDDFTATPPGDNVEPAKTSAAAAAGAKIPPLPRPTIPRHYPHIRLAMLAYSGNPMGAFEDKLLRESVDLVVPNVGYMRHIKAVAPKTPQLVYTNTSNLYLELLMSWLSYADGEKLNREAAFYHAARPVPFRGNSPSARPVTWFWGVFRGGQEPANLTSGAHHGRPIAFARAGQSLYLGYPEKFREINVDLAAAAQNGWSTVLEYAAEADQTGRPKRWAALNIKANSTESLTKSGRITFDPPADWKTASLQKTVRLFYVRFRAGDAGDPPVAKTILGRDYVHARGGTTGVIPAFDSKADANGDGYLDDREYAQRAKGKDARFAYESRMLTESYGQMRFGANPSSAGFRAWAVAYHVHLMKQHTAAGGLFMDNSDGKAPVNAADVVESVGSYAHDYGAMLNAISQAIAPRWVLANTALHPRADPVVKWNPAYMEEFAIRPLAHHYNYFEDLATTIARRAKMASPPPLAIIDSHPQRGDLTDPRMQLATLACYYLIADPDSTFLMLYGGIEPNSTWKRHWLPAVTHDIGKPTGKWSCWATGTDPADTRLTFRVYRRDFQKAVVLYKPLSYARGVSATSSLSDDTVTQHDLGEEYRSLHADGKLDKPITRISLRNGEGAILVKVRGER